MKPFLIVVYCIAGIYLILNLKHDIHMLQQNSYRIKRYWKYLMAGDIGSTWRIIDVALLFVICSRWITIGLSFAFVCILSLCKIYLILTKKFKKPLVFTKRVWRIYTFSAILSIGLYLWDIFKTGFHSEEWNFYSGPVLAISILLLMCIFSWITVIIAIIFLDPFEKLINRKYRNQASQILKNMPDLKVIGITGSYGKTSTKHFLERILSEKYNVLMTPGSFNTTMGVIRTIREYLKPYHQIFICEMGAKQKGDIKDICDLVHPEIGVLTAVGPMHLDTFKTMENVRDTKFELIDSLPSFGFAVINNDFEYCAFRKVVNVETFRYSTQNSDKEFKENIIKAEDIDYLPSGTSFTVKQSDGGIIKLHTKLLGDCNISNLLAAIAVAMKLGLTDEQIKRGVESIEPVEHRLSAKKIAGGVTILDDAFNSNPYGSKMALEVLSKFTQGKRIIVTPGMIELGDKQYDLNFKLGENIASSCDIAIIVGEYNREAIAKGIRENGFIEDNLYLVKNFNEAQDILRGKLQFGDTVLYENDLPDSFK